MRSTKALIITSVIILSTSTACHNSHFETYPQSAEPLKSYLIEGNKVEIDSEVLASQGSPIKQSNIGSAKLKAQSAHALLARGSKLAAILDTECIAKKENGMAHEIQENAKRPPSVMRYQAYSFELNKDIALDEFEKDVISDDCILQVSNETKVEVASTTLNDPYHAHQWYHEELQTVRAWNTFYGIKKGAVIAIVDSGINYRHAELKTRMWRDSKGLFGYDFINNDENPIDDHGHGTFCAGLIAAVPNNKIGMVGAMKRNIRLMAVKVIDKKGGGSSTTLVNGINYAIRNGADIINISISGLGKHSLVETALKNAVKSGVVVVTSAGNRGEEITSNNFYFPVGYAQKMAGVISVGLTTKKGGRVPMSNYGPSYIELASPGEEILSILNSNQYAVTTGTSSSAAIVSGAAGLVVAMLKSRGIKPTPRVVEGLLLDGSYHDSSLKQYFKDGHRLNLRRLANIINTRYPKKTTAP